MKRALKIIGVVVLVFTILVGVWVTDNLIYPFKSESPNFSDVEAAFSKLEFPADWQEISSSENRGLHGRGCNPFNDSGCFHKSKTFGVNDTDSAGLKIEEILRTNAQCTNITKEAVPEGNSNTEPMTASNIVCPVNNSVSYVISVSKKRGELSVSASTSYQAQ